MGTLALGCGALAAFTGCGASGGASNDDDAGAQTTTASDAGSGSDASLPTQSGDAASPPPNGGGKDASLPPSGGGDAAPTTGGQDAGHPMSGGQDASTAKEDARAPDSGSDATTPPPVADSSVPPANGGQPAGWLFTNGNRVFVSQGSAGSSIWVGRGVNLDDIFLCGYNTSLWMSSPDQTLETIVSGLISGWKPSFVRISLAMASDMTTVSWLQNPAQYQTPMTNVIHSIGANPGVYVLVTLRSDSSMIGQDTTDGDPEATGLPSDKTTTPDANAFPSGTDPTYVALVDTFAHDSFVLFGLTNEPGGNKQTSATIAAAMTHAVSVIRAEEDKLGVPHHVISVQGNSWTSDISYYATNPLTADNIVYEIHGYPPTTAMYTYSNLPVIVGEYGTLTTGTAATFFADVESKQIPNLAWDFEPYSNCAPDLLTVDTSATNLTPSSWGSIVQSYLLAHAQ